MKIMILANYDAGLYRFRRELLEELLKKHKVYICLPNGQYVDEMVDWGCEFIECDLLDRHGTNPMQELKLISYYKKVLKKIKPDIVFTYTIKPNVYGGIVCSQLDIPYLVNITGLGTAVATMGSIHNKGKKSRSTIFIFNILFIINYYSRDAISLMVCIVWQATTPAVSVRNRDAPNDMGR